MLSLLKLRFQISSGLSLITKPSSCSALVMQAAGDVQVWGPCGSGPWGSVVRREAGGGPAGALSHLGEGLECEWGLPLHSAPVRHQSRPGLWPVLLQAGTQGPPRVGGLAWGCAPSSAL